MSVFHFWMATFTDTCTSKVGISGTTPLTYEVYGVEQQVWEVRKQL